MKLDDFNLCITASFSFQYWTKPGLKQQRIWYKTKSNAELEFKVAVWL